MTFAAHLQSNDWLVFLDGVQVPWSRFDYDCQTDRPASGSLTLEPDVALTRLRPYATVALFCRDRYAETTFVSEDDELLRGYVYFGGGEVTTVTEHRQPHARGVTLTFESDLGVLDRHFGFASGVGGLMFYPWVQGTLLLQPFEAAGEAAPEDLLPLTLMASTFVKRGDGKPGTDFRSAGSDADDFGLRMQRIVGWLAAHHGALRMQCVRTRLLNKIAAVDDRTLTRLVDANMAWDLLSGRLTARLSSSDSVLTMVRRLQSGVGYRFVTCPAPAFPTAQPTPSAPLIVPPPPGMDEQVPETNRLRLGWVRNEYLFLPDLHYSAPPPCNLIFPDMLGSRSTVLRAFDREPTRSMLVDDTLSDGMRLPFVHIPGLTERARTTTELNALILRLLDKTSVTVKDYPDSPWATPRLTDNKQEDPSGGSVNTLTFVTDDELERGLALRQFDLRDEYGLARARTVELRKPEGRDDLRAKVAGTDGDGPTESYLRFMREWLAYKHQLARLDRPTQIELKGHRWIAPGFSAAIFDAEICYLTYVTGVRHIVDAEGREQTLVSIDRTRPLNTVDAALATAVRASATKVDEFRRRSKEGLRAAFEADTARHRSALQTLEARAAAVAAARRAWEAAEDPAVRRRVLEEASTDIAAYRAAYQILVGRAVACAAVALGPSRNEAGALTARRSPETARQLLVFLSPPAAAPETEPPVAATESATASQAMAAIAAFNQAQAAQAEAGLSAHGGTDEVVAAINESGRLLAASNDEVERLAERMETEADVPTPPSYYNEDFVRLETLDRRYQDLLGCQPFYTGPYASALSAAYGADGALAASEYVRAVTVLGRVFPAAARGVVGDPEGVAPALIDRRQSPAAADWDEVRASGRSTMEWQHRTFLRRKAQTLGEYLATHGFEAELETLLSDEPTPTAFRRMRPRKPPYAVAELSYGGRSFAWDDSVVTRLVDEGRGPEQDPLIKQRRAAAKSPSLTSAFRQELIVAYSRRHFGSRAFDGS